MIRRACGFGNEPMKRSALYSLHRRAGATFGKYSGWALPAFFVSPEQEAAQMRKSAGLTDISHSAKFDAQSHYGHESWRLGAKHFLIVGEPLLVPPARAIDVTSVYATLRLFGPKSRLVLGKLTSLNLNEKALPNLTCAQASLAHVPGIFFREDIDSIPAFHLLITRDYAESIWEAILEAGHQFHLCPSGLEAFRCLQS
jgi:glycine cleavage system aminomethyltransferase T